MVKKIISFTNQEKDIAQQIKRLKEEAGSHSPSIYTIAEKLPELNITVDACFLSNPYATELFFQYFTKELIDTGKIKGVLEYYPSQNQTIAGVLSKHLNVSPKNIFVANGATEIIQAVIHNFTAEKIVVNIPTFSPYYEFVTDGIEVIYNKLDSTDNFVLNVDHYIQLVKKEKPDTIVLINPNNPDGDI
jgi:histidinol-phosphate/aromatic aminotransferase/cobyric acid decarboxylase-like protein